MNSTCRRLSFENVYTCRRADYGDRHARSFSLKEISMADVFVGLESAVNPGQIWKYIRPDPLAPAFLRNHSGFRKLVDSLPPVSDRKLRLFAIASCRRLESVGISPPESILKTSEAAAEKNVANLHGPVALKLRQEVVAMGLYTASRSQHGLAALREMVRPSAIASARFTSRAVASTIAKNRPSPSYYRNYRLERLEQLALLWHIIGPKYENLSPVHVSSAAVDLAQMAYEGVDCGFALHDALLESGREDLAAHFNPDSTHHRTHPKGCWALDLILGKP